MRVLPSGRWLLPLTAFGMAALLVVRSANLVLAAAPPAAAATPEAAGASPPAALPTPIGPILPTAGPGPTAALPAGPAAAPAEAAIDPPISSAERSLLLDLRRRQSELDAREAKLSGRELLAAATDKRLTARLDQLGNLQQRLEALSAAQHSRDEDSWVKLVRVYETMKAKDAAAIFDDLDMPVLLQVMDRMKEPKAAAVLAAMQPERARLLTTDLARLRIQSNAVPPAAAAKPPSAGG